MTGDIFLGELPREQLLKLARDQELKIKFGPFAIALRSARADLIALLQQFYPDAPLLNEQGFCHYHAEVQRDRSLSGVFKPKSQFSIDGVKPFDPYPLDHAFPLFEWGLNWCIGTTANQYLMLHSAVVERNGMALILPAVPGSGKTTLCAGLVNRGWRLLSDEFGIVDPESGLLLPMPRAMPLKNESIAVIEAFAPQAMLGPLYEKTRKGDVRHLAPPRESVRRQSEAVMPRWLVFPRYQRGSEFQLSAQAGSVAFTRLSNNAFNYQVTMARGFKALTRLIRQVDSYSLHYSDLEGAIAELTAMADAG